MLSIFFSSHFSVFLARKKREEERKQERRERGKREGNKRKRRGKTVDYVSISKAAFTWE